MKRIKQISLLFLSAFFILISCHACNGIDDSTHDDILDVEDECSDPVNCIETQTFSEESGAKFDSGNDENPSDLLDVEFPITLNWKNENTADIDDIQNTSLHVGSNSYPLLTTISQADDCSPEEQIFNEDILFHGRIAAVSKRFEECVNTKVRDIYKKCNGDPWYDEDIKTQIEKVLAVSRSVNNVSIKCSGGAGNASTYLGEYGHHEDESFSWGGWFGLLETLDFEICDHNAGQTQNCRWAPYPWPYSQAAAIVWHEVMHTHGYTHGANNQEDGKLNCGYEDDPDWHFQRNTMPYIIGECIYDVIARSDDLCGGIDSCPEPNQLRILNSYNGSDCRCINDPRQKGLGILEIQGSELIDATILPDGNWMERWHYGNNNAIEGIGDFNGDGDDDILISSAWGIGIVRYNGDTWESPVVKLKDTWFGGWRYNASVNQGKDVIEGIGDFNGDGKADILIRSGWGIGILTMKGDTLTTLVCKPKDTWFGGWRYNTSVNQGRDFIEGIGDFNGDGKADILIRSGWGIGILTMQGDTLTTLVCKPEDTWFGGWRYNASVNKGKDVVQGIGDFNGDGLDDILLTSSWGIGMLTINGNSLTTFMIKPNGTWFGGWNFQSHDNKIMEVGDFDGNGMDDFIISSDWGVAILSLSGSNLKLLDINPFGKLFQSWLIEETDQFVGVGDFRGLNKEMILVQNE